MPFSRSNYRRWDISLPWHEAKEYLASGWRRTISPCQKDNCKWKAHADHFLRNSRYCRLSKDSTLDSWFLCEDLLRPLAQKMQPNSKKTYKPLAFIHLDNARVHMARATQKRFDVSRFKRTSQPPYSPDIAPSDFFFLVGWKAGLNGENLMGKMNYIK
jgi:hypothetical protein